MGGVDTLDGTWSLSVIAVNAWRLRMKVKGLKEPFLDFLRELVIEMFSIHANPLQNTMSMIVSETSRYDKKEHWIKELDKRRHCKLCYDLDKKQKMVSYACDKCNVGLHIACFKKYHVKTNY